MEVKLTRVKFWMIICHVTSALGTFRSEITLLQLIVKERSLVPDLVTYYSRDAQHDWIECFRLMSHEQKCEFLKGVQTTFLRDWR